MNTYLLGLAGKWITILLVSAASIFNSNDLNSETNYEVSNLNQLKNGSVSVVVLDYKTKKRQLTYLKTRLNRAVTKLNSPVKYYLPVAVSAATSIGSIISDISVAL